MTARTDVSHNPAPAAPETPPMITAPPVETGPLYDANTEPSVPRTRRSGPFIATKEYRRFTEFADAFRRETFIGLCYGPAGVGKTLSARRYAHWDKVEELLLGWGRRQDTDAAVYATLARSRTAYYTPTTTCTPKQLDHDLDQLLGRIDICVAQHRQSKTTLPVPIQCSATPPVVDLLIIAEAERLTPPSLEHLRDRFDRRATGLILIGMPGIDRSLSRHPQLYSRIGFSHQYRPLADDELAFVLNRHWAKLGLTLDLTDFTDAQAVAAVGRITRGNFRLVHRLFAQVARVMKINNLTVLTSDVIETARGTLVIGEDAT
ncbi:MAG: AAA family ATPase [Actinomycetota bacterium]|nr:AAA family ATPase [Actinomycetota bacterium]